MNGFYLFPQLIFRKVADVKKEKELAERRKNDPPLDLANDHPVRKLISRFRKISDTKHEVKHQSSNDLERGGATSSTQDGDVSPQEHSKGAARLIRVSENSNSVLNKPRLGIETSRWGRICGGSSSADASSEMKAGVSDKDIPLNDLSSKIEARSGEAPKITVKPMAKWGRLLGKAQEPIHESPEDEMKTNLKKTDSTDSGILRSTNKLDQVGEEVSLERSNPTTHASFNINSISNIARSNVSCSSSSTNKTSVATATPASLPGCLTAVEQHLLATLYDIRIEIKEEIESLKQKMDRIDEHIAEVLRVFSPASTPCSSESTYPNSKCNSSQNVTTPNSVEQSPNNSVSPSPCHEEAKNASKLTSEPLNVAMESKHEDPPQTVLRQRSSPPNRIPHSQRVSGSKPSRHSCREKAARTRRSSKTSSSSNESQKQSAAAAEAASGRVHRPSQVGAPEDTEVMLFQEDSDTL